MEPITNVEEAKRAIESFEGEPENFALPNSDGMQDQLGMNMAIITDCALARGWEPGGFEQWQSLDINAHGQIVGRGKLNGQERGFMLTPAEPVVLLTEPDSAKALALDSVTFERDAFTVTTARNFSTDGRRRVTLLARNVEFLPGETTQRIVVRAEDVRGQTYLLPVEHVQSVRGFPSFAQITVRLTDALSTGDYQLSVTFRGATSNKATIGIK